MLHKPGDHYSQSGKVNAPTYTLSLVLAYLTAGVVGVGYGFLSHINPLIYINFLILIGALFIVIIILQLLTSLAKSRNSFATGMLIFVAGFSFLYNSWCGTLAMESSQISAWGGLYFAVSAEDILNYAGSVSMSVGKFGRSGINLDNGMMFIFYIIEALLIIWGPIYMFSQQSNYYCEECDMEYSPSEFYMIQPETYNQEAVKAGDISSLMVLPIFPAKEITKIKPDLKLTKVGLYQCKKCNSAIADIELGKTKSDSKKNTEYKKDRDIEKGIYIDVNSINNKA